MKRFGFAGLIFLLLTIVTEGYAMQLSSLSLIAGKPMPIIYTCHGDNVSPDLYWQDVPKDTRSFTVILEDPDASRGMFTHWIIYNLPASATKLEKNTALPKGAQWGANSFGYARYEGPCPPGDGKIHRYQFKLYALDTTLDFASSPTRDNLLSMMKQHILAEATLLTPYGYAG